MSNWIDFDMLMLELEHRRNNAARVVKAYKEINSPTDWENLICKEAVGRVVALECIMAWCKDFKFSTEELKEMEEFKQNKI